MIEVITDITTVAGSGMVSVHYFSDGAEPAVVTAAISSFWADVATQCTTSTTFRVRSDGRIVAPETGNLVGFYNSPINPPVSGSQPGQAVADATQGLIQWRTGVVSDGREVRGRTFVPGLQSAAVNNGNLSTGARAVLADAADGLIGDALGFGVWRRPRVPSPTQPLPARPGSFEEATAASAWTELAVLRRRRK